MAGTTINPYRFGGQVGYRRDVTARQYVRARHLDTAKGRWASPDPIGLDGGDANVYRYAGNGPATFLDPAGLQLLETGVLCAVCAKSIQANYYSPEWHDCDHMFAHCLACCILNRIAGPVCAKGMQWYQDRGHPWPNATYCRGVACNAGIVGSFKHPLTSCTGICSDVYPFNPPSSWLGDPKCARPDCHGHTPPAPVILVACNCVH